MEKEKIDGKEFGYRIIPFYNKVLVEIYYKIYTFEFKVLSKTFGKFWRKPIENDYIKAKIWATNQMKYIREANN